MLDDRRVSCSYNDLMLRKQWWKVFITPLCHSSLVHLLLAVTSLWTAKEVEVQFGSMYFVKYSILLLIVQKVFYTSAIYLLVTRNRDDASAQAPFYAPQLVTVQTQGASGLVFAWLGFLSFRRPDQIISPIIFLSQVPISFAYLPILLLLVFQISMPRSPVVTVDCTVGLLSGYFLSIGLLEVFPRHDIYWSVCFLLNVVLFCLHAAFSSTTVAELNLSTDGYNTVNSERILQQAVVTLADLQVDVVSPNHSLIDDTNNNALDLESGTRRPI